MTGEYGVDEARWVKISVKVPSHEVRPYYDDDNDDGGDDGGGDDGGDDDDGDDDGDRRDHLLSSVP